MFAFWIGKKKKEGISKIYKKLDMISGDNNIQMVYTSIY